VNDLKNNIFHTVGTCSGKIVEMGKIEKKKEKKNPHCQNSSKVQ
jgi:hypothetical protein